MKNKIINLSSNNSWQVLSSDVGFPRDTFHVKMRVRAAVAMQYRYVGQAEFFTVDAGDIVTVSGKFEPGDIEVLAANSNVIEIECSTLQYGFMGGY